MHKPAFSEVLESIVAADPRYDHDAYGFVRDALDFTIKQRRKKKEEVRHVSGQELLEGIREFAMREFGPMVLTVFSHWGISRCEDFGNIVFNLIDAGVFGKTAEDTIEDFGGGYDFQEAFSRPFKPEKPSADPQAAPAEPAPEAR